MLQKHGDAIGMNTSAAGDIDWFVSGHDESCALKTPFNEVGTVTTATYTSLASRKGGAAGGWRRNVLFISVFNAHATDANTIEIVFSRSATDRIIHKATLAAGEKIEYSGDGGFV
jgi:hypothetical protein